VERSLREHTRGWQASPHLSAALRETVKVLFASGSEDLIPTAIQRMRELLPELPLVVVSEFPPEHSRWIPFPVSRGLWENLALCRWHFRDKNIRLCAVILQPRMPYWRMRFIAFLLAPWNFLAFNEGFGHFMLRPQSAFTIVRHLAWRMRNLLVWEFSPGGATYTLLWRLIHPRAFARPLRIMLARLGGALAAAAKWAIPAAEPPLAATSDAGRARGISVIVPSRNGRDLLARLLPEVARQIAEIGGEIIVVDNGSDDGTPDFLRQCYPAVAIEQSAHPLSFARAVNSGLRRARCSHVCMLNNDMLIEEGFFRALLTAFDRVPNLFCATAQIFFPPGLRREETGKAVLPFSSDRKPADFPLRCDLPVAGEDLSYVLYGSGGCSLFDAAKLAALRGLDEVYEPAYVEDLDLGFRGWRQGWPSVFVAGARVVHEHRATTSRYFSSDYLDQILELNFLRFVARAITDARAFRKTWKAAILRLNLLTATQSPNRAAASALAQAWRAPLWTTRAPRRVLAESEILALGSGQICMMPGRASRDRPVVMVASPYLPYPLAHGGAVRMFNLMRRAAEVFDLVLVTFADWPAQAPTELLDICRELVVVKRSGTHLLPSTNRPDVVEEFDAPAFHAALRQTVRKWRPSIVQLEFTQMAQYAADCAPAKTILVEHDITLDLYRQLLEQGDDWELRRQLRRWIPFEIAAWRRVDRLVTMSERDRQLAASLGAPPARIECLPNGVDLDRFRPTDRPAEPRRLLFIGSFAHLPNVLAADFFLRMVWPKLESLHPTLHVIAGARPQYFLDRYRDRVQLDLAQPGIEVEDFVEDVRPAYERAIIVVAPMVASAGTNIKIMEAMAMGKAIVSTPAGIHGLDLHPGEDVIVAETPEKMGRAIAELIQDPNKRRSIERQARRTVEREFNWDTIAARQAELYRELIGQPSRVAKAT
jgi:glycosyltransferase involved in cell wall biosynthesis/GT2 family glycosyltransferase